MSKARIWRISEGHWSMTWPGRAGVKLSPTFEGIWVKFDRMCEAAVVEVLTAIEECENV